MGKHIFGKIALSVGFILCVQTMVQAEDIAGALKANIDKLAKTKSCAGCNLAGADLIRMDLSGADLEGADLGGANFSLANLSGANLKKANLQKARFGGADLGGADLRGADLAGAEFSGAYLGGVKADGDVGGLAGPVEGEGPQKAIPVASSAEAKQAPEQTAGMEKKLADSQLKDGEKEANRIEEPAAKTNTAAENVRVAADSKPKTSAATAEQGITPAVSDNKVSESPKTEQESQSAGAAAPSGKNPSKQEPVMLITSTQSEPPAATKTASNEDGAERGSGMISAEDAEEIQSPPHKAEGVKVAAGAVPEKRKGIVETDLVSRNTDQDKEKKEKDPAASTEKAPENADIVKRLLDKKKCYECNLKGTDLSGKNLSRADLEGANLSGCNLERADLSKANLKGALLINADLKNADLSEADLYKADLSGADLTGAKMEKVKIDDTSLIGTKGVPEGVGAGAK